MNFEFIEDTITNKYFGTLTRKNIVNIQNNKFIKKPYIEKYIVELSTILNKDNLKKDVIELLECNEITNEELFLFIKNNIDINIDIKIFFNDIESDNEISIKIIIYQIKYFRFYNVVTELLFDNNEEDNELYNFILIFIKNKNSEIKTYLKKNMKFNVFYCYLNDLYNNYESIMKILLKLDKKEILNMFLKNLFTNWYNIYKKDILENKVNDKIKNYVINRNILSRILCLPTV